MAKKSIASRLGCGRRAWFKKYDKNKDGVLQPDEIETASSSVKAADLNGDGTVTSEELAASQSGESTGSGGSGSAREKRAVSQSTTSSRDSRRDGESEARSSDRSDRRSGRRGDGDRDRRSGRGGNWVDEYDRDQDGQVAMNEFTSTWSTSKVAEFQRRDADGDGFVTREEGE